MSGPQAYAEVIVLGVPKGFLDGEALPVQLDDLGSSELGAAGGETPGIFHTLVVGEDHGREYVAVGGERFFIFTMVHSGALSRQLRCPRKRGIFNPVSHRALAGVAVSGIHDRCAWAGVADRVVEYAARTTETAVSTGIETMRTHGRGRPHMVREAIRVVRLRPHHVTHYDVSVVGGRKPYEVRLGRAYDVKSAINTEELSTTVERRFDVLRHLTELEQAVIADARRARSPGLAERLRAEIRQRAG